MLVHYKGIVNIHLEFLKFKYTTKLEYKDIRSFNETILVVLQYDTH